MEYVRNMKKTKIVATIGPKSDSREMLVKLSRAGVNVFRLNFSHGSQETHAVEIDTIKSLNLPVAIMLDTKGPEIRTGVVRDKVPLTIGDKFVITVDEGVYEETGKISVNYRNFVNDVDIGDVIVLDSGAMRARAIDRGGNDITFEVTDGHANITTRRHINLFGKPVSLPAVTDQDWSDIDFGLAMNIDMIALSFVRSGRDVRKVKDYCIAKGHRDVHIISKIENFESTQNIDEIILESDGIMIARGDLACEIQFSKVPAIQKKIITLCSIYKKPVIVATQMVLSMVDSIQPTRAEVSDVANAVFERADAVMTSDETAKGNYPLNTIEVMAKIASDTEEEIYRDSTGESIPLQKYCLGRHFSENDIIGLLPGYAKNADAIVVIGNKPEYLNSVASARINLPILSFTNSEKLRNNQNLVWNTTPILADVSDNWIKNIGVVLELMRKNYSQYKNVVIIFEIDNNLTVQIRTA
ncbi:MAG: pyruvate kinase [Rickettsiales bacterium]|jgi:pyruvate kinase|nr:pyruvate kinase [Rickettsiales bacterium]